MLHADQNTHTKYIVSKCLQQGIGAGTERSVRPKEVAKFNLTFRFYTQRMTVSSKNRVSAKSYTRKVFSGINK